MRTDNIRTSFVDFFGARAHTAVPSSSLVPRDDPTLLFTNAGMVQFKRVFQGLETRDDRRAVTVQKCVRAGGKHNDLEQVGHTARHHTFFEMLGNFSFGDYFKREAIEFAWEWVTAETFLGIDPQRLFVTVHHTDDEARRLWRDVTGIAADRIYGLGDKDNFWQMGDTGPCGPCSEIFVDLRGPFHGSLEQAEFEALGEAGQLLEIWNLVFMQFDQAQDGSRTPLPAPSVDTGAGLERIAAVMQKVPSNFDTDIFQKLIGVAVDVFGKPYDRGPAGAPYRVLADHARAVAFLLADGVFPSSDGRGYVLRRILRRAVRHAYLLGRSEPTLVHLAEAVVDQMGGIYPELERERDQIAKITRAEEESFLGTIEGGLRRVDELTSGAPGTIRGEDAFKLHDTYGFPLDLTMVIARERGWDVDVAGFERALEQQREQSRAVSITVPAGSLTFKGHPPAISTKWQTVVPRKRQRFVGYETTEADTEILKFRRRGDHVDLILRENPFYAAAGGQVSDTGVIEGEGWTLDVDDVLKDDGKQIVTGTPRNAWEPTPVHAAVDEARRRDIERNHSATHLVHAALREVLGTHVRQAGSVVAPDRLRFDFSHFQPVTDEELARIEEIVNQHIWDNVDVETREMAYRDALELGAMALFGEKYGDIVRVVDMPGVSIELCGGTHVRTTGQIGLFQFTGESGVAAGVRRIEARTGPGAYQTVKALDARLSEAAEVLRTNPEHLSRKIEGLLDDHRRLEKRIEELLKSGGGSAGAFAEHSVDGVTVLVGESDVSDRDQIGMMLDAVRNQRSHTVAAVFAKGDRPGIHVAVTDDLVQRGVKAGEIVQSIASVSGGRGGGKPHFASAGAGDPSKLGEAMKRTPEIVKAALSR